jgi:hypothetical protein
MEIPGARVGTAYPGSRPRGGGWLYPASNPLYEYMCTGGVIGGVVVSSLDLIRWLRYLGVSRVCFSISESDLRVHLPDFIYQPG